MAESTELQTALRFLAHVDDEVAGERLPLPCGTAIFDRIRPLAWDANYVRAERLADLDAADLAALVEPLFAERQLAHRQVVVPDERQGRRLQRGFAALGWVSVPDLVMASARPPEAPRHPVEEVSFADLRKPMLEVAFTEPPGGADPAEVPALVEQLASRDELVATATAERRFVVRSEGGPVAWCRLYGGDGVGQIEQVTTHPDHRNRGYGRSVLSAATAASRERGDRLTFLVAVADDWPQHLYHRLGFEATGTLHRFRRLPQGQRTSSVPS